MAKRRGRKSTKRRTRRATGFNIKTAIFAYANLAVATRAITNTTPWHFLTDGFVGTPGSSTGHSPGVITLREMFSGSHLGPQFSGNMNYLGSGPVSGADSLGKTAMTNLQANAVPAIFALVGLKVADKVITKLGVSRNFNKVVDSVGMKGLVRA